MKTTVTDYVCVAERAIALGCQVPTGMTLLPDNFETATARVDLLFRSEAATIKTLFRNNQFPLTDLLPTGERAPSIHNKNFEWAPALFISAAMLSENPDAVSVALGIISNYATDFFKGMGHKNVRLVIVVEKKKNHTCKKISYEGDIAGLSSLPEVIQKISDE